MLGFDEKAKTWDDDPVKQERAIAVANAIRRQIPISPTWHALEYGCGTGLLSFALHAELGSLTLADSSPGMLAVLDAKIAATGYSHWRPLLLDLVSDSLPDERYDLIYTLMTLHHITDLDSVLRAFFALLRPNGWLAIADLDQEDGSFHGPGFTGHCGFRRDALQAQLEAAGLVEVSFSTCYAMRKITKTGFRDYPLFLAAATRPG